MFPGSKIETSNLVKCNSVWSQNKYSFFSYYLTNYNKLRSLKPYTITMSEVLEVKSSACPLAQNLTRLESWWQSGLQPPLQLKFSSKFIQVATEFSCLWFMRLRSPFSGCCHQGSLSNSRLPKASCYMVLSTIVQRPTKKYHLLLWISLFLSLISCPTLEAAHPPSGKRLYRMYTPGSRNLGAILKFRQPHTIKA